MNDENAFRKGEWRDGQFYPYKSQADMGEPESSKIERQWRASGWAPSDDDDEYGMPVQPRGSGLSADDFELLTLAARALGVDQVEPVEGEQWVNLRLADGSAMYAWNPLMHSDDAFNLQVELQMRVVVYPVCCDASAPGKEDVREIDSDRYVATRRAITRAAAEIGKAGA